MILRGVEKGKECERERERATYKGGKESQGREGCEKLGSADRVVKKKKEKKLDGVETEGTAQVEREMQRRSR